MKKTKAEPSASQAPDQQGETWTRSNYIPEVSPSHRASFEALSQRLQVTSRAASEGEQNRPHTADVDLDETQQKIVVETRAGANLLKQFLANRIAEAATAIKSNVPRPLDAQLVLAQVEAVVSKTKVAQAERLEETRLEERRRFRGLRKFRQDHGLSRPAEYALEPALPMALLLALIALEAILNAFIFRSAVDGGLFEGWWLAVMFSAVNVALGIAGGFFGLRWLGHKDRLWKLAGGGVLLATAAMGLCWNLRVAEFRIALERTGGDASFFGSASTNAADLGILNSTSSIALVVLGLAVFVVSVLKGRGGRGGLVDSYWGYRGIDIAYREAEAADSKARETYRKGVEQAYEAAREALHRRMGESAQHLDTVKQVLDQARQRATEVRDSIGEWIATGQTLLRRYRETNRAVRTALPPVYFDQVPDFGEIHADCPALEDLIALVDAAKSDWAADQAALAELERLLAERMRRETDAFNQEMAVLEQKVEDRLRRDWTETAEPGFAAGRPAARPLEGLS